MEEYRQKQRFTDTGDEDSDRLTIENTRALKDLTEEINKLNMRFMRGLSPAGNEAVEGREYGGPVRGGQRYLVGEGHRPELFIPRQEGGPVRLLARVGRRFSRQRNPARWNRCCVLGDPVIQFAGYMVEAKSFRSSPRRQRRCQRSPVIRETSCRKYRREEALRVGIVAEQILKASSGATLPQ